MQKLFQDMQFYTDIHCHILPGVDDGAGDMEESMQMLRIAYANRIRRMIVTPHHKTMHRHAGQEKIQELIAELSERMKQEQMEISLYPGSELYYSTELVDKLESRRACTMAESAYVLVEFAPMDDWEYIRNGINTLIMAGYIPILAHGSDINCARLCDELGQSDDRISVIHKENGGVSTCRNYGIENAKGEWIAFVDADDWVESEYVIL